MLSVAVAEISSVSKMHVVSYPMKFHVEATGVAHRLSLCVSSPQGGGGGVTVGAGQAHPPRGRLQRRSMNLTPDIKHCFTSPCVKSALVSLTSRLWGLIRGLLMPFILWYSPQALHR